MSDMKSKLPDLKELTSMTSKLFHDIKTSVGQIIQDYKEVREKAAEEEEKTATETNPENEKKSAPKATKKNEPDENVKIDDSKK